MADAMEAVQQTLGAMRAAGTAQPVVSLPDWVWGILINDQMDRGRARRLVRDTVHALQARDGMLTDAEFDEFAECVLNDNPDVADG